MTAGPTLRALRHRLNISVREVERASGRIAKAKGDKRFRISNAWLSQLERGISEPGICKLFSLSVIYHLKFPDLMKLYDIDVDEIKKYEPIANPGATQLLSQDIPNEDTTQGFKSSDSGNTSLLSMRSGSHLQPFASGLKSPHIGYGYIGLNDFTMYPLIRPGSIVRIDTLQDKLQKVLWHNEYERPIYFLELRGAHACGWCELQGTQLLIVPHHSSPAGIRRLLYPREVDIVGRVIGFETSCVDEDPGETDLMNYGARSSRDK